MKQKLPCRNSTYHGLSQETVMGIFVFFVIAALWPNDAWAATTTSAGDVICNVMNQIYKGGNEKFSIASLFNYVAYITGGITLGASLYKFRDHSIDSSRTPLTHAVAPMAAGTMLLALPGTVSWIVHSVFVTTQGAGGLTACTPGTPQQAGTDPSAWITNLVNVIKQPMNYLFSIAAYTMGTFFVLRGLNKGAKYGTDPRAASMPAILANLVIGGILFTSGSSLDVMLQTMFGGTGVEGGDAINSWSLLNSFGGDTTSLKAAVRAALTFFQVMGTLAFIRGWLIVKNSVEGSGQATMTQGFTHVIGGIMAINIFYVLEVFDYTLGTRYTQP